MKPNPRVFIGYHEVAGYCGGLEAALRSVGARPHFCELRQNRYYAPRSATLAERLIRRHLSGTHFRKPFGACVWRFKGRLIKAFLFFEMIISYDAFIFVDRFSPLGIEERVYLRRLGKRVISVFLGSDSRPMYQSGAFWDRFDGDHAEMGKASRRQFEEVRAIESGSDIIVCHALCAQFLSKPFARFLAIGFPFDEERTLGIEKSENPIKPDGSVVVVHAPSKPKYKGTQLITKAVKELVDEGVNIKLILIVNRPNSEVLMALAECDFVVDELYSDTPLAGIALEAAAFGKPSIVGTYATKKEWIENLLPPSATTTPGDLKDTIRRIATNPFERLALGSSARAYLDTMWSLREVGMRFLRLIQGDIDQEWMSNPSQSTYVHGWGIDEDELKKNLRSYLEARGVDELCLEDKPELVAKFEAFSGFKIT